jgi:DNA polymerase III epsilon subunit-like protein
MGTGMRNESLCIRVSAVDYFTAEVLVDKLVFPDEEILNYNTRYSGVTPAQMMQAKSMGDCLLGIAAAREAIWKFIGPDTIVVAHSGQNDLNSLRWLHDNIVDTHLVESLPVMKLEKEAREKEESKKRAREERSRQAAAEKARNGQADTKVGQGDLTKNGPQPAGPQKQTGPQKPAEQPKKRPKGSGRFSLKSLTMERVGSEIQMGKQGHDSVKDAVATRDVAHWNVVNFGHGFYKIQSSNS